MEAAAAMDFHALSRRELQALCKRNGVRANMTNAAMAEALQGLTSVDGIDEIGTTLCLPTPGRSVMKSAAKMPELAGEEQQLGSPLPRGRRVSVKSPEAIRMEVEEGEDEMKRDLVKEIVKTPGVALRSTSHRTRATPAPLPTPAPASNTRATVRRTAARKTAEVVPTPATLRRSQRTSSRKAEGPVESAAAKVTTTPARSKMTMAFDHEAEVAAPAPKEEEKVQQDEPKAAVSDVKCEDQDPEEKEVHQEEPKVVASDVKCDDPEEEEVTKLLEGDSKEEELEEGEEVDSSDAITGSAVVYDKRCNDPKVEEVVIVMEEQFTKSQDGILEEKEPTSVEKAPLTVMEDSPILGLLSKEETAVPVIEEEQDVSVEDCEDLAESSPAREMTDEIIPVKDKEVVINAEAVKEDGFAVTGETDPAPTDVHLATVGEDTIEEDGKKGAADEMSQSGESEEDEEDCLTESTDGAADEVLQAELTDDETSEEGEDDLTEVKVGAAAKMLQGELTDSEISEEDDLDEDEGWTSDDDENIEETGSTDDSDEDTDETNEESYTADAVQMGTSIAEEANEDASTEDDDFSGDLPSEFDNITISDAENESGIASSVLEENQAAVASATKTATSLDASAMNEEHEEVPEEADATEKARKEVDNIVKSLDEFTFKLGEANETRDYSSMSLRQLRTTYKQRLVASKAEGTEEVAKGKRLPLEEVDDNACSDH